MSNSKAKLNTNKVEGLWISISQIGKQTASPGLDGAVFPFEGRGASYVDKLPDSSLSQLATSKQIQI